MAKGDQGMLVLTVSVNTGSVGLLLIIDIGRVLHLGPHEIPREQLPFTGLLVKTVELLGVRYDTEVPAGPVRQILPSPIGYLRATGLRVRDNRGRLGL